MAEGILRNLVKERGEDDKWKIDSAGTGDYHVGCPPEERTTSTLKANGITDYVHYGRVIERNDFYDFKHIFVMDNANKSDVLSIKPKGSPGKVIMLGSYDYGKSEIVKDPYYQSGSAHFADLYDKCLVCCKNFLEEFYKTS